MTKLRDPPRQTTFGWQVLGSTSVDDFFFADTGNTQHRRENGFGYALRVHRSIIVNLDKIVSCKRIDHRLQIELSDGSRVIASRAGSQDLREHFR